jgi:outer membrane protein OmpA-like peptidoglycan-associated protein
VPEKPSPTLPKAKQKELQTARSSLMAVLTDNIKSVAPQKAARAQLLFDCRVHKQNMHISEENAPCTDEFRATLAELQQVAESFKRGKEISYDIRFEGESAELDDEARTTIDGIAEQAASTKDYKIVLRGVTGKNKASRELLDRRLIAIKDALAAKNITASRIITKRTNNSKLVILSGDVVQETGQVDVILKLFGVVKGQEE